MNGENIGRLEEHQLSAIDVMGLTFGDAFGPEAKDFCTAISHLTGQTINRFYHIHRNSEDLHKKQDMTRALCTTRSEPVSSDAWE